MRTYRNALPQLRDGLFLSDGGIETTLIFHDGLDLPDFAAFHVLKTPAGEAALRKYFRAYVDLAKRFGTGLVLESATWRSSPDWGARIGYSLEELDEANRKAIWLLEEIRKEYQTERTPIIVSGCVGPRGDGYVPGDVMSAKEAEDYHHRQIEIFAKSSADLVTAITMNYVEEAVGIAQATKKTGIPVVLSFTVETDGNLPTGQTLKSAIQQVDKETGGYPAYYMINCAHPTHFEHVVSDGGDWLQRIRGIRANASHMSHDELNEAPELDEGNPVELGMQYARLKQRIPTLSVMGGCCGTDHRHIEQIATACIPLFQVAAV
ncbi:MAG TPA: homocysteine S-methyltransferase family protein [Anaerolineales bacterium]|nr:homocysteine S-methyltransferase family protein [Anaerolineales bacterium]